MKQPKCHSCGSKNVILETDLESVLFYIDDKGNIDFEEIKIRQALEEQMKFDYVSCECADCGESWDYEED